jgi:hypothetical protein
MAHQTVQLIIRRIVTDEPFRDQFVAEPDGTL